MALPNWKPAPTTQAQRKAGRSASATKPPARERKPPKPLKRTGFRKPGARQLKRSAAKRAGVKAVRQTTGFALKRGQKLKPQGVRGRRLAPGDRKQEAASHQLPCACGCNAHLRPGVDGIPGKGLISRAHLIGRGAEATRNVDWNNLPACLDLADWLDHNPQGEHAKADLLKLAQAKGKRLTPEEVRPILETYCYKAWYIDRRARER